MAVRFKACVGDLPVAGNAGSNPAGGKDVCLFRVKYVVRYRALRRADHMPREVLPKVLCLILCDRERVPGPLGAFVPRKKNK